MVKFQIPKKLFTRPTLPPNRGSSSSVSGGINKKKGKGSLQSARALASIQNLVSYFKNGKKKPASDKLNENQELEWEGLTPGTQAPAWLPKPFRPFWAAGKATETLVENAPEIVSGMITGKGFTWEGSKYIGPQTDLSQNYQPMSQMDDLARIHDYQYGQLEAAGVNPYFTFNEADRYMLDHVNLNTAEGWAIYVGIGLKQIFPDDYTEVAPVPPYTADGGQKQIATLGDQQVGMTPTQQLENEYKATQRDQMFAAIAQASMQLSKIGVVNKATFIPPKTTTSAAATSSSSDFRHRLTFLLGGPEGVANLAGMTNRPPPGGTPNAPAPRKQSLSARQLQESLPFASTLPPFSSLPSRDLTEPSAPLFRPRGLSSLAKYSMMKTPRNYKKQTFQLESSGSSNGLSIPSFVKR